MGSLQLIFQGSVAVMSSSSQDTTLVKQVKPTRIISASPTLSMSRGSSMGGREDPLANLSESEQESLKQPRGEGWISLLASMPQPSVQETISGGGDTHLVEFSDALHAVGKALRQVAESKARAQDEAAKWKLKYEMELLRCRQLECLYPSRMEDPLELEKQETDSGEPSLLQSPSGKQTPHSNGQCCLKEGICNQQVLRSHTSSFGSGAQDIRPDGSPPSEKCLDWRGTVRASRAEDTSMTLCRLSRGISLQLVQSSKQITLVWDSPPHSVFILSKPNSSTVENLCKEMVRWLREEKGMGVYVEPRVKKELLKDSSYFSFVQTCETEEEVLYLHKKVDLVITLGGDGTVLWAASMFKGPVPPVVSFSMGSLGFMTPFQSERYKECLQTVMEGPVYITLRHRLHCQIVRNPDNLEEGSGSDPEDHLVLNEVSINRGMSSFLTNLECYCDGLFVTCVQGDGLILSTPSGSTAYSLAAGGSMVHPQVPGILFTPICPHSLSFRPLILPEYVTLRVQVPANSRGQAWASFDGKDRQQLSGGDALVIHMSAWPVPAACDKESTNDFLRSVRDGLHWNLRKSQLSDGPPQPT